MKIMQYYVGSTLRLLKWFGASLLLALLIVPGSIAIGMSPNGALGAFVLLAGIPCGLGYLISSMRSKNRPFECGESGITLVTPKIKTTHRTVVARQTATMSVRRVRQERTIQTQRSGRRDNSRVLQTAGR